MSLDVLQEVVRPHEGPTAGGADELLLPGVSADVLLQRGPMREGLVAVGAFERLLT